MHLSLNVLAGRVLAVAVREYAYGSGLLRAAEVDPDVVVLGVESGAAILGHADGVACAGPAAVGGYERAHPGALGRGGGGEEGEDEGLVVHYVKRGLRSWSNCVWGLYLLTCKLLVWSEDSILRRRYNLYMDVLQGKRYETIFIQQKSLFLVVLVLSIEITLLYSRNRKQSGPPLWSSVGIPIDFL